MKDEPKLTDKLRSIPDFTHELLVSEQYAAEVAYEFANHGYTFAAVKVPAGATMFLFTREAVSFVELYYNRTPYEIMPSDRQGAIE